VNVVFISEMEDRQAGRQTGGQAAPGIERLRL
jgi:hypothetical protein